MFHSLKPEGWRPGHPCDFGPASVFLARHGFGGLRSTVDVVRYEASLEEGGASTTPGRALFHYFRIRCE